MDPSRTDPPRIVIAGAGSIGLYLGGCLALAGRAVTFLLRPRLRDLLAGDGLRLTDLDGRDRTLPPASLILETDPARAFAGAELILVTVKCLQTAEMADLIAAHAPPEARVISLQNGVGNAALLAGRLPGRDVLPGMVPFNVLRDGNRLHRGTGGAVLVPAGWPGLTAALAVEGLPLTAHPDMEAVLWGKLLLNLNNALNALSGLPLRQQLAQRPWRLLLAAQQAEALAVLRRAGIRPAKAARLAPGLIPLVLRLPDPLFRRVARAMLDIDPQARSSMWEDLEQRRPTEIAWLQGAVLTLAAAQGQECPTLRRVLARVRAAEAAGQGSPRLTAAEV